MFHVNGHVNVTSEVEYFNNQVDRMTHFLATSHLLSLPKSVMRQ
jgi:hypothetical protein